VSALDFAAASAPVTVNAWVSANTKGRIAGIVDRLDPVQVLTLVNAVYFKGRWSDPFDARSTRPAPFHKANGDTLSAQMMHTSGSNRYVEDGTMQMIELPYAGGRF